MIVINNQEEMQKYYDDERNTYKFNSNVKFNCDIDVKANIFAQNIKANNIKAYDITALDIKAENIKALDINSWDIKACDIKACCIYAYDINACDINAFNIKALDINAGNIKANKISFYAVCFAYKTFVCNTIRGIRENSKYFCLDSDVVIKNQKS